MKLSSKARRIGTALLGLSVGGLLARWQLRRASAWQAPYTIDFDDGRLQIRRYAPQIHAETIVDNRPWPDALTEGFERLAAYVFGANSTHRKLPMTSPVLVSVTAATAGGRAEWRPPRVAQLVELNGAASSRCTALVMPADLSLDALPQPNDQRIRFRGVHRRRMAVLRFRGSYRGDLPAEKRNELLFLVKTAGLKPASEVWFGAYDGPATPPFLRRNEVMVELGD